MKFGQDNKYKVIVHNTTYLSVLEILKMVMPFVALPYLISTVGADKYGLVVFAQAIISYFIIFINFGLDVSAVKNVSINRSDNEKLSEVVSSVLIIKAFLFILSFLALGVLLLCVKQFRDNYVLFLLSFLSCLSEILFPVWFYQGVEKISLFVPTIESIRRYFKESVPFFVSRVSVVINASMAKTICGIFFSMHEVAVFDLAQKIAMTALVPLQMLNQALFPHIAKTLDRKFVNKCFRLILLATGCIIVIVYILAPFAVFVLSDGKLPESVDILHVFSLFIFSGGITSFTGSPVLVSFGYSKPFNRSVVLSTFVLIVIYMVLYFTNSFSIINFALALGFAEFVIAIYRLYYCNRYKLIMLYGRV